MNRDADLIVSDRPTQNISPQYNKLAVDWFLLVADSLLVASSQEGAFLDLVVA